ncbi:MAG: hypothetical protein KatS3mg001_377 [Candidatus Pacearchaeota archaeon]|nr:MAG: hypothetical protein KatS3mg001_377 [Candidatus Pacearchaeota archaeon]
MKKLKIGNKKGAEKIISVYWFAMLFIVAASLVYIVSVFYGKPYDIRKIEADFLADKIASCFSKNGFIKEDFSQINSNNFLDRCSLTFDTEDSFGWKNDQYYIETNFYDLNSGNLIHSLNQGNPSLKNFCNIKGENFPVCLEKTLYTIDKQNNQYQIKILSIVRKTEKNV